MSWWGGGGGGDDKISLFVQTFTMCLSSADQTGDGCTHLNEKYGY